VRPRRAPKQVSQIPRRAGLEAQGEARWADGRATREWPRTETPRRTHRLMPSGTGEVGTDDGSSEGGNGADRAVMADAPGATEGGAIDAGAGFCGDEIVNGSEKCDVKIAEGLPATRRSP
jgi:hypothetical protein